MAKLEFCRTAPVVDGMHKPFVEQKRKGARYGRTVYGIEPHLKLKRRDRPV